MSQKARGSLASVCAVLPPIILSPSNLKSCLKTRGRCQKSKHMKITELTNTFLLSRNRIIFKNFLLCVCVCFHDRKRLIRVLSVVIRNKFGRFPPIYSTCNLTTGCSPNQNLLISAVLLLITKCNRSGSSSNKEVPSLPGSSANQNCYFRFFFCSGAVG